MTEIPHDTRERLKHDLAVSVNRVEAIKLGVVRNYRVLDHYYLTPLVDDTAVLPMDDPEGEFRHYKEVGHIVLNILTQGQVPPKFKPQLENFKAPKYIMNLLEESASG